MKSLLFTLVLITMFVLNSCQNSKVVEESHISIIPKPALIKMDKGAFVITSGTKVYYHGSEDVKKIANLLTIKLMRATGFELTLEKITNGYTVEGIIFSTKRYNNNLGKEGYELTIDKNTVLIEAMDETGLFYGLQTIIQLLPSEIDKRTETSNIEWTVPALEISDNPRFAWRGMLLDCCRHFMDKDFIKRYIDLLAYHKMNRLHWHLTEDQGWRIEIERYPELTDHGSWRKEDDGSVYGGFYTQEDIKEIVAYAKSRMVEIIPEIELPGHSLAAISTYPHLSCTGESLDVTSRWGVHKDIYCAGKESTFEFLENVLDEVIELFPSEYIHIGGDEAPKFRWEQCNACQKRISDEGLKDEHELQSYFITRIEKYLNSKGKKIIGWDEILEGGLAPSATVQAWRGFEGAIEAAELGHDAIVSPTSHAYFDYKIETTDLKQVYSFEPIPAGLDSALHHHILGGECNMWTERAPQEEIDDRMFPRLLAMSEVLWSAESDRDFSDFHGRVQQHYQRLEYLGVNYGFESKAVNVDAHFDSETRQFEVKLISGQRAYDVYYTIDGSQPTMSSNIYQAPVYLKSSSILKAFATKGEGGPQKFVVQKFDLHIATGKTLTLENTYSPNYTGTVDNALIDGIRGTSNFRDGRWQGFFGEDIVAVIDLGERRSFQQLTVSCLQSTPSWIFMPREIQIFVSDNGIDFQFLSKIETNTDTRREDIFIEDFTQNFGQSGGRYIKVVAVNFGLNPNWHDAAGSKCWLFADEIILN